MLRDGLAGDGAAGASRRRSPTAPVQLAGDAHRHEGDPHRRARHADHRRAQAHQRVRQHVVGRRLLRRGHRARPRWAGARTSSGCRRTRSCTPAKARATRSASPGRAWRPGCAAGCPAARSAAWWCATASRSRCASTSPSTDEHRQRRLPADGALRLPPVRRGDQQRARAAHARLGDAARAAHPQRRDHQRPRRAGRAADGPPVQELVDRLAAVHRRGAGDPAPPERHHHAGGRLASSAPSRG